MDDLNKQTVSQLKERCKLHNIDHKGMKKKEMIEEIIKHESLNIKHNENLSHNETDINMDNGFESNKRCVDSELEQIEIESDNKQSNVDGDNDLIKLEIKPEGNSENKEDYINHMDNDKISKEKNNIDVQNNNKYNEVSHSSKDIEDLNKKLSNIQKQVEINDIEIVNKNKLMWDKMTEEEKIIARRKRFGSDK